VSASKLAVAFSATALLVSVLFATPVGQAASRLLPKNSVGAAQIKSAAVTGSKVKNGSLMAADFKSGQLPAGPKGDPGAQGPKGDPGASATKLWAYVNYNGTLRRGSGIASTNKVGAGFYSVTFDQSIANCVGIAGYMTDPGDGGYNMSDHFEVLRGYDPKQMYVAVYNSKLNTNPDIPFALIVVC